LQVVLGII